MEARRFTDAWNGVRPMASRIITSVHERATGEYKTASGPTRTFAMDCGVGIGCVVAPDSSGPYTTLMARVLHVSNPEDERPKTVR